MKQVVVEDAMELLDARFVEEAAFPAKRTKKNWWRTALLAACSAVLMTVTVWGGVKIWQMTMEPDGPRWYSMTLPQEAQEQAPAAIETLYMPHALPVDDRLRTVYSNADGSVHWSWQLQEDAQFYCISFTQQLLTARSEPIYSAQKTDYSTETLELEDLLVTKVLHQAADDSAVAYFHWTDGQYRYQLFVSAIDLISDSRIREILTSVAAISREDYLALADAHPYDTADSQRLHMRLAPGFVPRGLTFCWWDEGYAFGWEACDEQRSRIQFLQEHVGRETVWGSGHTYHQESLRETLTVGHRQVQVYTFPETTPFLDFRWVEDDTWCMLRFDLEIAQSLDEDLETVALRLIESMRPITEEDPATVMDQLN